MNTASNIDIEAKMASEINSKIFRNDPLIARSISVSYRNPWTFSLRIPSDLSVFHKEESANEDMTKNGVTYSLWYNEDIDTKYEINSTIENIQSFDSLYNDEDRYIEFKYISNKIRKPINPRGGHYLSFSSSISSSLSLIASISNCFLRKSLSIFSYFVEYLSLLVLIYLVK